MLEAFRGRKMVLLGGNFQTIYTIANNEKGNRILPIGIVLETIGISFSERYFLQLHSLSYSSILLAKNLIYATHDYEFEWTHPKTVSRRAPRMYLTL